MICRKTHESNTKMAVSESDHMNDITEDSCFFVHINVVWLIFDVFFSYHSLMIHIHVSSHILDIMRVNKIILHLYDLLIYPPK